MKKKLIFIILAAVLALALIITGSVLALKNAFGNNTIISVGATSGSVGEKVKVPVEISGNPGFAALMIDFEYDTSLLKYITYDKGDVLSDYGIDEKDGSIRFLSLEYEDKNADGVLFYLVFEIIGNSKSSAEIKAILEEDNLINSASESISAKTENGAIEIK